MAKRSKQLHEMTPYQREKVLDEARPRRKKPRNGNPRHARLAAT